MAAGVDAYWRPLWRSKSERQRPALTGALETEIAIVGAGLEGLSLAATLSRLGKRVAVIEAAQIGHGATGASAGIVAPQLIRHTPDDVAQTLGTQQAASYLKLLASAGTRTFELLGARRKDVEGSVAGFIAPAKGTAGAKRVATTVEQWRPFRSDLKLLSAEEIQALTGAVGYSAALLDPTGGALNPLAYADLLAGDAEAEGAAIYLDSPVSSIEPMSLQWRLVTRGGSMRARRVILCANGGNATLSAALRRSVLPLPVCQMATESLSAEMRRTILPQGHAMTDIEPDVFSIRFDAAGRLITAYPMSDRLREPGKLSELANQRLRALLPSFRTTPLEFAWTGLAWLNSDLLPRIVAIDEGLFAVQACNGRGIALSTAIGQEFGRWLVNGASGECAIPIRKPRAVPGYTLARYLPSLLMRVSLAKQRLRRALRPHAPREGD